MKKLIKACGVLAGAATFFSLTPAYGTISLNFTDNDSTPTSTLITPGSTFPFSVTLGETLASEQVSGADYQIHASSNGVFEFLSRNSQVPGSSFTSPNGSSDAVLNASPVILNPNNGTDLGTSTASGLAVAGPGTYELADFSFKVLSATLPGVYTLSFVATDTSGPPPNYATGSFNTLGTFTVVVATSVPEPASIALFGIFGAGLSLRPRRR